MKFSEVEAEPLVPTIVAVVEPVGVPPLVPPPPPPAPPLVPPQLAISMIPAMPRIARAKDAPERKRLLEVRSARMLMPRMASSVAAPTRLSGPGAAGCRLAGATALGAVVLTVSIVTAVVAVELRVADDGLKLQVAPLGRPEQLNVTVPLKPCFAVMVALIVPESPGAATVTVGPVELRANAESKLLIRFAALMVPRPVAPS